MATKKATIFLLTAIFAFTTACENCPPQGCNYIEPEQSPTPAPSENSPLQSYQTPVPASTIDDFLPTPQALPETPSCDNDSTLTPEEKVNCYVEYTLISCEPAPGGEQSWCQTADDWKKYKDFPPSFDETINVMLRGATLYYRIAPNTYCVADVDTKCFAEVTYALTGLFLRQYANEGNDLTLTYFFAIQ